MELRHLRSFVAIAVERSFTRAAERLWVARAGLSAQIRLLENELGVQFFDRHTRGVDPTDAGDQFLGGARIALAAVDAASAAGSDARSGLVGKLRLVTARNLQGEQIVVTAHRDGAGYDRAVKAVLEELGITAVSTRGAQGPALHRAVAAGAALALSTARDTVPPDVVPRPLDPRQMLGFALSWRGATASPALTEFIRLLRQSIGSTPPITRTLAAVA